MKGLITDIQKFSLHDGPGIRTTIFLKGCNMRCLWCHNPEAISLQSQLAEYSERCIECGNCIDVCTNDAMTTQNGQRFLDRLHCDACGSCVDVCPSGALSMIGTEQDANDVFAEIAADIPYYRNSGGGVTISGGEPLLQVDFCTELLQRCWEAGIDTAIETNLSLTYERIERVLPWLNRVFFDIKIMDNEAHKKFTGVGNQNVLKNSKLLDREKIPLVVRTPVIPGISDSEKNIRDIAAWVSNLKNISYYELLNYNPLAPAKYVAIGREYSLHGVEPLPDERMKMLVQVAQDTGVQAIYR